MEDLIAWLQEQLADDERVALAAIADRPWGFYSDGHSDATSAHLGRWSEGRVLTLVAAMREILSEFSWEAREVLAIQLLAEALYGGRDGYRQEWRSPASRLEPFTRLQGDPDAVPPGWARRQASQPDPHTIWPPGKARQQAALGYLHATRDE